MTDYAGNESFEKGRRYGAAAFLKAVTEALGPEGTTEFNKAWLASGRTQKDWARTLGKTYKSGVAGRPKNWQPGEILTWDEVVRMSGAQLESLPEEAFTAFFVDGKKEYVPAGGKRRETVEAAGPDPDDVIDEELDDANAYVAGHAEGQALYWQTALSYLTPKGKASLQKAIDAAGKALDPVEWTKAWGDAFREHGSRPDHEIGDLLTYDVLAEMSSDELESMPPELIWNTILASTSPEPAASEDKDQGAAIGRPPLEVAAEA